MLGTIIKNFRTPFILHMPLLFSSFGSQLTFIIITCVFFHLTLFRSIIMLCGTNNILHNIFSMYSHVLVWMWGKSHWNIVSPHIILLWIWIMLCTKLWIKLGNLVLFAWNFISYNYHACGFNGFKHVLAMVVHFTIMTVHLGPLYITVHLELGPFGVEPTWTWSGP